MKTKKEKKDRNSKEKKAKKEKKGKKTKKEKAKKQKAPHSPDVMPESETEVAPRDFTSHCSKFSAEAQKWLDSAKNTSAIEILSVDTRSCAITFQFTEEECEFVISCPKEDDDLFQVSSDHLDESFSDSSTEAAMAETRIQGVLKIVTEQFLNLSEEDFDGEDEDFGYSSEDDAFGMGLEDVRAVGAEKRKEADEDTGPEIDESAFSFPAGYEPAAIQSIIKEYRSILKEGSDSLGFEATPVGANIAQWEIKLYGIPKDDPLWKDMKKQKLDHICMHVTFPPSYPFAPPFFRVLRPRFKFRTGHVTLGGAICTMLLSNEGWTASYRIANVLVDIRAMFTSGNGRLDMKNRADYSESEAMVAFNRLLSTHGWTHWKS